MKVNFLIMTVVLLTGCVFGSSGPSDEEVTELIKRTVEGGMDAFCPSPEVQSINILERGSEMERKDQSVFPIRVEVAKKCGSNMFSRGETKTGSNSYIFYKNEYGDWRASKSSF